MRRALLLYRPASRGGRVAQAAFYFLFTLAVSSAFGSLMPDVDGPFQHWTEIIGTNAVLITFALVLRTVAVDERDRRRYLAEIEAQAPTTARARVEHEERVGSPVAHV